MMKTTLDLVDRIWSLLNGSAVKSTITGGIYKFKRPAGSIKEDIVINSLPITGTQVQSSVVNINVHVPNISIVQNGVQDNSQPNTKRLKEIAEVLIPIVEEGWYDDGNFSIQQTTIFEDDVVNDHYLNIRLDFFVENL